MLLEVRGSGLPVRILLMSITSAATMVTLANLEGEESFDPSQLGTAETVVVERVCDDELILIKR